MSATLSLPIGHSTPYENSITYRKCTLNKHIKAGNPQKRSYQRIYQLPNPSFLGEKILEKGKVIPNKEELVIDKEKKISFLKLGGDKILSREGMREFREPNPISKKDPPLGKGCTSNFAATLLPLHIFC